MNLFSFASRSVKSIELGIEHQTWAVGTLLNQQSMQARVTKAQKYLHPGAYGVLYCNPWHAFTTPFIVKSHADPNRVVTDIWPEPWRLPFKIKTLGTLSRRFGMEDAAKRWPTLKARLAANNKRGGVSAAFNITGTTVFVPVTITTDDWATKCSDLAD
jgi:hypothetical protein